VPSIWLKRQCLEGDFHGKVKNNALSIKNGRATPKRYKLYSTNLYTVWCLYQFKHFLYELYSTVTYVNSYKSDGMNSKKYLSEKVEVSPLAPGIKDSLDKCTKKKRYSLKNDSIKSPTCTFLYQKILATIHKSGLYDFTCMAYSQPLLAIPCSPISVRPY